MPQRDPADPHNLGTGPENFVQTITFAVDGLNSEECASTIEEALRKREGIQEVKTDLNAEMITVSYDSRKVDTAAIHELILSTGYKPAGLVG